MRSLAWVVLLAGCGARDVQIGGVPLALDQEEKLTDQPLSASTQSINRYHSVLQKLTSADLSLDGKRMRLRVKLGDGLTYENIDARFVVPLLDYPHEKTLTPFDKLNLMLAEYSRSGVELAHQEQNREYGYFTSRGWFDDGEEYTFEGGKVVPNEAARPKRMALVNNCLFPGLWEIAAADSVGEMFHAWMKMPEPGYFALVRAVNGIDAPDAELSAAMGYVKEVPRVAIDFARLRDEKKLLGTFPLAVNEKKPIASYSTQDSRRKVQRKFYRVERDGKELAAQTFGDLAAGDLFQFHSFIPPGIYTKKTPRTVPYEPIWAQVEIREVAPKTRFFAPSPHRYDLGAIELTLRTPDQRDGARALVVGNLPVDLLVYEEDYDVPGFGVGVLRASEPVEKRYLFMKDGPAPVYAYSAFVREGKLEIANNHEQGLEQIYLRPYEKDGAVWLRITLVAYERIVDLLEVEVKLPDELGARIKRASAGYTRPIWRSFSDSNIL